MKNSTPVRVLRARRQTAIALGDLSELTPAELIANAAELHDLLAECDQFSRAGQLGVRKIAVDRLLEIDAEHQRRIHPPHAA